MIVIPQDNDKALSQEDHIFPPKGIVEFSTVTSRGSPAYSYLSNLSLHPLQTHWNKTVAKLQAVSEGYIFLLLSALCLAQMIYWRENSLSINELPFGLSVLFSTLRVLFFQSHYSGQPFSALQFASWFLMQSTGHAVQPLTLKVKGKKLLVFQRVYII